VVILERRYGPRRLRDADDDDDDVKREGELSGEHVRENKSRGNIRIPNPHPESDQHRNLNTSKRSRRAMPTMFGRYPIHQRVRGQTDIYRHTRRSQHLLCIYRGAQVTIA